ncbi:polarity establishment/cellular polarization [Cytospora paraplurivora]|uniref:Polarity establishment/cellular polarization n=1 Tax=Cytospora paraplurivora TaxID=2898453 RepID=A0AAN9UAS5_9PEZI
MVTTSASSDNVTSVITDPTASWIIFTPSAATLSGNVPTSLNNGTFLITINAESISKGLSYSFQLRLVIQDISQDYSVRVPVVASNAFTINMAKYFPASSQLTALDTNPKANWISFDAEENIIYGSVPDLAAGAVIAVTVNAFSTGSSDSSAALYTRVFSLEIEENDIPDYNVILGDEFVIDLSLELLNEPGDYLTSVSTNPTSEWVTLNLDNRTIAGTVPITLAAGSSVSVTGDAINPSLGSSYRKQYSLVIAAGENITVPVVVGDGFQVNLTEYLQNTGDTIRPITLSPEVSWVTLNTEQPPYLYGTVPKDYAGSEVNSTVIAISQVTGLTYSLLVTLDVFATTAILEFDPAEPFVVNLVPLLQTSSDLVNSIRTYPEIDWISLDASNRSLSGLVPPTQPSGTTVNITVDSLTADVNAANKRDLDGILSRQTETESGKLDNLILSAFFDVVHSTIGHGLAAVKFSPFGRCFIERAVERALFKHSILNRAFDK